MNTKKLAAALSGALPDSDCDRLLTVSASAKDAETFAAQAAERLPKLQGSPLIEVAARALYGKPKPKKRKAKEPKAEEPEG